MAMCPQVRPGGEAGECTLSGCSRLLASGITEKTARTLGVDPFYDL